VRIESLLQRLETTQAELAKEALGRPTGRDAFEYGRAVGLYAGLELAKTTLIEMVSEHERKGFDL
jgi:tetrahydromethanopterin S-methyltransferase subunit G